MPKGHFRDPSEPMPTTAVEHCLYEALDALAVRYIPQCRRGYYIVDAWLPAEMVALEVDGCVYHGCPQHALSNSDVGNAWAHTLTRDGNLRCYQGVRVLHIWSHALPDAPTAARTYEALYAMWETHRENDAGFLTDDFFYLGRSVMQHATPPTGHWG